MGALIRWLWTGALIVGLGSAGWAWTSPPSYQLDLAGFAFGVVTSSDQAWTFVSLTGRRNGVPPGIAVLHLTRDRLALVRTVPMPSPPTDMVLTHDGKILVAAAGDRVILVDVDRMTRGDRSPIVGTFSDGAKAESIFVNVTADDRTLFVSDEGEATITVVNLQQVLRQGFGTAAVIGKIPVGNAPIALTFSPDERWLYTTSEGARGNWAWPKVLKREGRESNEPVAEGAVIVVDVVKAKTDPAHSVVARIPAGGSPVRLALSASGDRLFVTARNSDAVLVFDTAKLWTDPDHARVATVPVGSSPVPIALIDGGRKLVVGNSARFSARPDSTSTLTVVEVSRISEGGGAVLGSIRCGAFPRELRLSPDGKTLLLTNYLSGTLQVIRVEGDLAAPR
jgi:DNA-binding beta-propeller fold protein YncE